MRKCVLIAAIVFCVVATRSVAAGDLAKDFVAPPDSAKPRVYWWWLNSRVSKEGITRDLEEYHAKGIGGVLLFDAGMPAGPMPSGPKFMSPEWLETMKHALREADRLGIEVSVNLCSGWDAGGPWITPEFAAKQQFPAMHRTRKNGGCCGRGFVKQVDGQMILVVRPGWGITAAWNRVAHRSLEGERSRHGASAASRCQEGSQAVVGRCPLYLVW